MRSLVSFLGVILLVVPLLAACGGQPAPTPVLPTRTPAPEPTPEPPQPLAEYTPTPQPEIDSPQWFDDTVLYEIFVRSFYDSDEDGIGDLPGITSQLDYVQSLGVNAIWLMPIHPSPSYHGYDVTGYFDVNPDYGTLDDMRAFVAAAHQRDIKVILDLVINHTSNQHPVFKDAYGNRDSEYADWFLWTDDYHLSYEAFGGFKHMPKLNHDNPEVTAYVLDIVRFWMDLDDDDDFTDGIDGFRCDVAKEVPLTTWQRVRDEMRSLDPDSFLLGEVWEGDAQNLTKWYADAFDALFDFPLYHTLAGSHDQGGDGILSGIEEPGWLNAIIVGEDRLFPPGHQLVRFTNNHDTDRIKSDVGDDWARAHTAATLLFTLPGTPMIYYGEAIGMRGEKGQGPVYWDEYRREPMDWFAAEEGPGMTTWFKPADRFNAPHDGISTEEQELPQSSPEQALLSHYRALSALRHAHPALRSGSFGKVLVSESDWIYAYTRHAPPSGYVPEEWFLVMLNFGHETQSASLALNLAYTGPFTAVNALSGETWPDVPAGEPYHVTLPPASGVVLALTP